MSWLITGTQKTDPDAASYLSRVEAADGQALEPAVRAAIEAFVVGCKADGTWSAIKASCILTGARTLNGALVPLVGTAPTRLGTEGGWNYNRKTGLQGNGTNNYINSNYQFTSVGSSQDNNHLAYWRPASNTGTCTMAVNYDTSANNFIINNGGARNFHTNASTLSAPDTGAQSGFRGITRSSSASYSYRGGGLVNSLSIASVSTGVNLPIFVFARNNAGVVDAFATGRKSYYSIGESLDLALLDTRVTTLINAIAAAIP